MIELKQNRQIKISRTQQQGKKKNSSGLRCLEIETLEPVPVLGLMGISLKWQKRSRGSPRRDNCLATQVFWRGFYVPDKWGLPKIPPARLIFPGQVGSRSRLDSRGIVHAVPGSALGIWAISLESTERFHPDLCSFGSVQDPSSLDLVVWWMRWDITEIFISRAAFLVWELVWI